MPIEHIIWRFLSKKRFGTFLACILIPEIFFFTEVNMKPFSTAQRFMWVGIAAAMGAFSFAFLTTQDWLRETIRIRQSRQESVKALQRARLLLYLFVLPFLLFSILLVIVIYFF